jgi:hypothetical protein
MEKEFVPYELALRMKQFGFNEPCFGEWQNLKTGKNIVIDEEDRIYNVSILGADIKAPTYSQAFRWFREKYKVRFFIQSGMSDLGEFFKVIFPDGEQRGMSYITYEEAELACLQKLIEIVKTK